MFSDYPYSFVFVTKKKPTQKEFILQE